MATPGNRSFTIWLAASLIGAVVLVGGAKLIAHDAPVRPGAGAGLRECTMADGRQGYEYSPGLCTLTPPLVATPPASG